MELRFGFAHQPVASEQDGLFHLPQCTIPKAAPPKRLLKVLWAKEVEVEPALTTTGSSGVSLLSLSHSSNIILL